MYRYVCVCVCVVCALHRNTRSLTVVCCLFLIHCVTAAVELYVNYIKDYTSISSVVTDACFAGMYATYMAFVT